MGFWIGPAGDPLSTRPSRLQIAALARSGHDEARATQPVQADLSTLSLADEITAVPSRTKSACLPCALLWTPSGSILIACLGASYLSVASIAASASPHDAVAPPSPSSDVPLVDAQQPTNASGKRRRVFRNSPVGDDTGPVPAAEQPADDAQSDALYKWPPFSLANPSISMPGGLRVNVPLGRAGPIFGDLQHDDQIRRLKRLLQQNDLDGRFNSVLPKAADSDAVERLRRICAVFPVVVVDAADEPSLSFPPSTPLNHDIALGSKQLLRYYVYYLYAKAPDSETLRRLLRLAREPVWQNKAEAASLEVYWSEYLLKLEEKVGERRQLEVLRYVGWSDGFDHVEPGRAVYFRPSAHFSTPAATPKSLNALVLQLILDFNTEVEADGRSPIELSISFLATAETLPTDLSHTDVMLLEAVAATRFQTGVVSGGTNVSSAGGVSNRREMLQAARALPPEETLLALVHREPPGATSSSAVLVLAQHYGSFGTVAAAKARLEQDLAAGSASPEVAARLAREDSSAEADKRRRSILQPLFAAAPPPAPPVPAPPPPTQPAHTALCSSTALTNRSNASPRSSGKAPTWITPQGRHSTQSQSRREVDSVLRKFHPSLRQRLEAFRDEPFALALFDMIWSNTKRESGYSGILTPQTLTQGVEVELRSPSPRHPTRHRITVYACAGHDTALLSFWVSTASHPSRAIMKVEGDKIVVRSETSGRCIGIREKRGPSQPATPWKWTATHMLERVQRPSDVINKEAARRKRVLQRCLREAFARSAAAPRTAAKNGLESYGKYTSRNADFSGSPLTRPPHTQRTLSATRSTVT